MNISGKCVPVLKVMKNIGLDYKVKYRFLIGTVESNQYIYLDEAINMVHEDFNVQLCRQDVKEMASLRDFHVTYDITVTRTVTEMTDIEEEFNNFKKRYDATFNRRKKIELTLDHEGYEVMPLGQFGFIRYEVLENGFMCPETIAMVDLQFCDAVVVPINIDQLNGKGLLRINSLKFNPSEYLLRSNITEDSEVLYAQICRDIFEMELEELVENHGGEDDNDNVNGIVISSSSVVLVNVSFLLCLVWLF